MSIDGPFLLPADVSLTPVAELSENVRSRISCKPNDWAVSRPHARLPSSIIGDETATLLGFFRQPQPIVDAVITFSEVNSLDPDKVLDDAFPVLEKFINDGLLVREGSPLAQPIRTSRTFRDSIGSFQVVRPVQVMVDTELYLARTTDGRSIALKLASKTAGPRAVKLLEREATVLSLLDGGVNPSLVEYGVDESQVFVAMSWCNGIDLQRAADEIRRLNQPDPWEALLELAKGVLRAYAHLHGQGFLQGDVHPRNALVDDQGHVWLLDYGLAQEVGMSREFGEVQPLRGGIDMFMEPEWAKACLANERTHSGLTVPGEQYSVAAMLYLLLAGGYTHEFSLENQEMLRQIVEEEPLPFTYYDIQAPPGIESILRRALQKNPDDRFSSLAELSRAFDQVSWLANGVDGARVSGSSQFRTGSEFVDRVIGRLTFTGSMMDEVLPAPTASVMNGAAGLAYALLKVATVRDDEHLLAAADVWSMRALEAREPEAYWNPDVGIVEKRFGRSSLYHTEVGVHCVAALVATARQDDVGVSEAVERFLAVTERLSGDGDVVLGEAGVLLGCAELVECRLPIQESLLTRLEQAGDGIAERIAQRAGKPTSFTNDGLKYLGIAHGWSGILFSLLRWDDVRGREPRSVVVDGLDDLLGLASPVGRGLIWPRVFGLTEEDRALDTSWCNGAAGFVHLWALAQRSTGDERYGRAAEGAAWAAYEGPSLVGDLCCGLAGRAYALLGMFGASAEDHWLVRARDLGLRAIDMIEKSDKPYHSLYKGCVGVAVLWSEIDFPEMAQMPLFANEGQGTGRM